MKHSPYLFLSAVLVGASMQISCVDDSYDLKHIDKTIGLTADLTLPTSSTGDIFLKSFMDLEEDGIIQYMWDEALSDSVFCVRQTGSADIKPVRIGEIRIKYPRLSSVNTSVNLRQLFNTNVSRIKANVNNPLTHQPMTVEIDDRSFHYDFTPNDARYSITNAAATGISADVLSIERVAFGENARLAMSISLSGFPKFITHMHLDNLALEYPTDLNVVSYTFNGKTYAVEEAGKLALSGEQSEGLPVGEPIELVLEIGAIQTGEYFTFDAAEHRVDLGGYFTFSGSFRVETSEFDAAALSERINALSGEDALAFVQDGDWNKLVPEKLSVSGSAEFENDIVITRFTGSLLHDVGAVSPIVFNNLPDFLNDPDVVLDLANPVLYLSAENGLPANLHTGLTLTSPTCDTSVAVNSVEVNPGKNTFYIADKAASAMPLGFANAVRLLQSGSVPALVRRIPKQIEIGVAPISLDAVDLDLTKTYPIDVHYEVVAPFTCGPDFMLKYTGTEGGWAEDLKDLDKIDADKIELRGEIDSNLPADIELTIEPIDVDGNTHPAIITNTVIVKANAKNNPIVVTIEAKDGYSINDALSGTFGVKKFDGIRYTARILNPNGSTLRRNASICIHDIDVTIRGEVTYDGN